jgi:hypothetical protein
MICGVPVDGETGATPGGDAVTPVAVPVVLDPVVPSLLSWFGYSVPGGTADDEPEGGCRAEGGGPLGPVSAGLVFVPGVAEPEAGALVLGAVEPPVAPDAPAAPPAEPPPPPPPPPPCAKALVLSSAANSSAVPVWTIFMTASANHVSRRSMSPHRGGSGLRVQELLS